MQSSDEGVDLEWTRGALFEALVDGLLCVWPVLAIMGGVASAWYGIKLLLWYWRRHMLRRSGIREIDAMGGEVFEQYLATLFSRLGYRVELTRFRGDFGGDLVVQKDRVRTAVQAKRHAKTVGIKAVQEAVGAKAYYECEAALVVTNSYFSRQAVELAEKAGVELWDRDELVGRLSRVRGKAMARAVGAPVVADEVAFEEAVVEPAALVACGMCSKPLTVGERRWCEANVRKVRGRMLCMRHQRIGAA